MSFHKGQTGRTITIAVIPDTQIMAARHPHHFDTMCDWLADQTKSSLLQAIVHVGDIVDNGADEERQFIRTSKAMERFQPYGVPWVLAIGNHDYDDLLKQSRNASMFNAYFGGAAYREQPWFGDSMEPDAIENCYIRFIHKDECYLILNLEFAPRDRVLDWADRILKKHADHTVFVVTHLYMYMFGERTKKGDKHDPDWFPASLGDNDGERLWEKCFRHHANIVSVFSGHHGKDTNVSHRVDYYEDGRAALQTFQNWQSAPEGGEGRVRIFSFNPDSRTMTMSVYNPAAGHYEQKPGYELTVTLKANEGNEYAEDTNE